MAFDQSFLVELKARAKLTDVVSSVVQLKRAGSNLVGLCPFHSERTPSFTVFEATDNYYCFGCGEGGDVITFVMRTENLDYVAAVEWLCARAGMRMPEQKAYGNKHIDRNRFFELNRSAARFFHEKLLSPEGEEGLAYLRGKRALSMGVIRHFGLGYAPKSWDALTNALKAEGYTEEELQSAFLAGKGRGGNCFDYFRSRVMFPIIDVSGRIIAFGGRVLGDETPKYLNSSDTPVFKKRMNLYALNFAKNQTEKSLIFCEGYMDVIALHSFGFTNAVATLGTAITPEQARLVKRYADKVFLCYDSDEAGQRATRKAIELLEEADIAVKVVTIPDAKDPDEYLRKFGKESFAGLLSRADGHIEYAFSRLTRGFDLTIPEEKLRFVRAGCEMLAGRFSPLEREIYLARLAELSGVEKEILRTQIKRLIKSRSEKERHEVQEKELQKISGFGDKVNPEKVRYPAAAVLEEQILGLLFLRPEYFRDKATAPILREDVFVCAENRKLFAALRTIGEGEEEMDVALLARELSTAEVSALMGMKLARQKLSDNSPAVLTELFTRLEELRAKEEQSESSEDIAKTIEEIRKRKGRQRQEDE